MLHLSAEPALTDQSRHRERCNSRSHARRTVLATFGKLLRFFDKVAKLATLATRGGVSTVCVCVCVIGGPTDY